MTKLNNLPAAMNRYRTLYAMADTGRATDRQMDEMERLADLLTPDEVSRIVWMYKLGQDGIDLV